MILDGKSLSDKILTNLKKEIEENNYHPTLCVILAGDNPASEIYVSVKEKACRKVGIESVLLKFDKNVQEDELLSEIEKLNNDERINAILVQLPLPDHINKTGIINKISPQKDVDGFTIYNTGCLTSGNKPYAFPCTPKGIIRLLREYNISVEGKHVVVVGRSDIVGKPVAGMLLNLNATVTVCHSKTTNLKDITKTADILVSAVGKPYFITEDMVKNDSVIIDVGISRVDGKLKGDVDFENIMGKTTYITPVPKGVGPMTIASLMENTLELYKIQNKKED